MQDLLAELERCRAAGLAMGGPERIERHHRSGRLTVRERIDQLIDPGSWYELGLLALPERREAGPAPCDAVVTGFARVGGRKVCINAIDATVLAGTTAPVNMRKQGRIVAHAVKAGLPLIFLSDADGGRIPDVMGWRFSGLPFDYRTFLQVPEGVPPVPRITAVLGPTYGDAALHAPSAHFVVMKQTAALGLSGPPVVGPAIGEDVTDEELGGPAVAAEGGTAHMVVATEAEALEAVRRFLSYLPDSAALPAPTAPPSEPRLPPDALLKTVPTQAKRAYDMRRVIDAIVDADSVFHWRAENARNLVTCLARIEGEPVGIVANQPLHRAGILDERALAKEFAFVELCDTFNLPLVFLHDLPGLMIGTQAERGGVLQWFEKAVSRVALARVPKVSVIIRKSYGGGHFAMGGRPTHPDLQVAWPTAELGFMAPETGVNVVHRRKIEQVLREGGELARDELVSALTGEWARESEPWEAAAHGYIDDVIDPRETRRAISTGIAYGWGSRPRVARTQWREYP